jgi:hypothetical protein
MINSQCPAKTVSAAIARNPSRKIEVALVTNRLIAESIKEGYYFYAHISKLCPAYHPTKVKFQRAASGNYLNYCLAGGDLIPMKNLSALRRAPLLAVTSAFVRGSLVFADDHNDQVTGPILGIAPTSSMVKKGKYSWEVSRDANTPGTGDVKVGAKATNHMVADTVTVK